MMLYKAVVEMQAEASSRISMCLPAIMSAARERDDGG
ncbi:hypothetical protein L195_g022528 [Trifolium pratense]|uniref:Uncharacterized protein n=1 Tax=Trifolium pratense TaxID=57577 RepID=A0A2K3N8D4_TRIPR|nr:hypothetical protein L195_g022528 [Trifolium pratense]